MKIEEAKTKWCFQNSSSHEFINCIADKCMAWRWNKYPPNRIDEEENKKDDGYCGLAGKKNEV